MLERDSHRHCCVVAWYYSATGYRMSKDAHHANTFAKTAVRVKYVLKSRRMNHQNLWRAAQGYIVHYLSVDEVMQQLQPQTLCSDRARESGTQKNKLEIGKGGRQNFTNQLHSVD